MTSPGAGSQRPPEAGLRALSLALRAHERETAQRFDALQQQVDALLALADTQSKSAAAVDEPESWHWDDLDDDAYAQRRADLEQWIARVLQRWHPASTEALRPCWPRHRPAIAALDAARIAWTAAYRGTGRRGTDPAAWLRDWLPALERQLAAELGDRQYPADTDPCAHHQEQTT